MILNYLRSKHCVNVFFVFYKNLLKNPIEEKSWLSNICLSCSLSTVRSLALIYLLLNYEKYQQCFSFLVYERWNYCCIITFLSSSKRMTSTIIWPSENIWHFFDVSHSVFKCFMFVFLLYLYLCDTGIVWKRFALVILCSV